MSQLNSLKPYSAEELAQQSVWAEEFNAWWESEGQYHRAGGNDYCRTFAWWAWLNRQQNQNKEIERLKTQLDQMEQCYIEVKKERDSLQCKVLDFKNIKNQRDIAETMLKKVQVICQRKLPDFGSALRAKADIDRVLRNEA